ncbi:MAG TPA: Ig-like domain-containing protein [Candidatus Angelobacter sp.]|nr:Ig-like domain-containing protein [Candidatus Angelobacter sp.]
MINGNGNVLKLITLMTTTVVAAAVVYLQPDQNKRKDIPNRLPEAAPYVYAEAKEAFPPPYHEHWEQEDSPGQCQTCHQTIFDEWNGSMMSNSWRDPAWRAAFLLLSRATSANGECDTPAPPDGTVKATHNPFANQDCSSTFDLGTQKYTVSRPGSLLDFFCSRCHMPTDYVDNFPLRNVKFDSAGREMAPGDPNFFPTSDNGTGIAYATLDSQFRNTESGKSGIICAVCHTYAETRDTPFHNYAKADSAYKPATDTKQRSDLLPPNEQDTFNVPDKSARNLGYAIGAGSYRLSPHAIVTPERFGPLVANQPPTPTDSYTSGIFGQDIAFQQMDSKKHKGYHQTMFVRAEMCAACHDVTNALPIKNKIGKWVGGFPIERTYTEWANSAYADRPGNKNFDPNFKRDCQSCHMQQDYGQPGTAQTLYKDGKPLPPPVDRVANQDQGGSPHPFFTHHFVGGNAYIPHIIGKDVDSSGNVAPYPELSAFSFSSDDHKSVYSRGFWTHVERRGAYSQQARLAWDRLRHVLTMDVQGPTTTSAGSTVPLAITVANTGSGHDFPTGFPEGRTAWLVLHAYDLASGKELAIHDNVWNRTSLGVGNLTTEEIVDPNFPGCNWKIPAGSADPYSVQFKAIATLGDNCPTLDLPYATPMNLVTNNQGLPIDKDGRVIDTSNPGMEVFKDSHNNGDLFEGSFLRDSRFKPRGRREYQQKIDRYSVVVPPGTQGPIAVSASVYYQSIEAVVALKFLGNMADTNNNFILEPCVLGGLCDGRKPSSEPPVVEGAPPVPMVVRNFVIPVQGAAPDKTRPQVATYPQQGASSAYQDTVPKVFFSRPIRPIDSHSFTVADSHGVQLPGDVGQIGDGAWGFFPNQVLLKPGERYTARLKAGVCDWSGNCTAQDVVWSFTVSKDVEHASGDTTIPMGFHLPSANAGPSPATSRASVRGKERNGMAMLSK